MLVLCSNSNTVTASV